MVFDREFSYTCSANCLELLENLVAERVHFVIRLTWGSHPPRLTNAEEQSVVLKIDENFRDIKKLLHLEKLMNKKQTQMEKRVAPVMLAFSIGLLNGEGIRDAV